MNLMGLDISLTSTGYSCSSGNGTIQTKLKSAERLSYISAQVLDLAARENIDCVVLEGYSFASRNSQAHSIGELGGCIRMRLWESGFAYVEVPPTSRAKFATGKGNSSKNEVVSAVSAMTGIVFSGPGADDMCDAWILRQMGLAYLGVSDYTWPKLNLSALEKIDWAALEGSNE